MNTDQTSSKKKPGEVALEAMGHHKGACFKKEVLHHESRETQRRLKFAPMIVGPPIVLLIIGFVVAWVARGFKAEDTAD